VYVVKAYPDLHVADVNVIQDAAVPVTPVTPHVARLAYSLIVAAPFPAFKAELVAHAAQAFAAVL